jgi:hypothetical protein
VRGGPPASVQELDTIPSPFLSGILEPELDSMMLELSRGCLHSCGYCTWNSDKQLRHFSPARIEAEVRWARERGHRHITLNDSAINYDTPVLARNVAAVASADPAKTLSFTYNLRHELVTAEQLACLAKLQTHMVLCGVETLHPPAMTEVERSVVNPAALHRTLHTIAQTTIPPVVSIVLGLPGDTEEGFRHTLETLLSWCVASPGDKPTVGAVLVSLLQVYRGSRLWHRRQELGLRFDQQGIPYLLEGGGWSCASLARAKAYLVQRMAEVPDLLKAAEAIVCRGTEGESGAWLETSRIDKLILPWRVGMTLEGWTLAKRGTVRDTGNAVSLRFAWQQGGGVRVRLMPRRPERQARFSTRLFDLAPTKLPGPTPPRQAASRLLKLLYVAIRYNELALTIPA